MENEVTLPREETCNVEILFQKRYDDEKDELERKYKSKEGDRLDLIVSTNLFKNTPIIPKKLLKK